MVLAAVKDAAKPRGQKQIDLYRFFALVFGAPSPEHFQRLAQPGLEEFLSALWTDLGCTGDFPGTGRFRDYQQYESIYIALFDVGLPQPPVPLLESAHVKSQPAQQIALENTFFYEVLGLKVDPAHYAPDHLVTQLEFLAAARYAREQAPNEENRRSLARLERDFLERHLLNWLPAAEKKLKRERPPVFPLLLTLLLAFLRQRYEASSHEARE